MPQYILKSNCIVKSVLSGYMTRFPWTLFTQHLILSGFWCFCFGLNCKKYSAQDYKKYLLHDIKKWKNFTVQIIVIAKLTSRPSSKKAMAEVSLIFSCSSHPPVKVYFPTETTSHRSNSTLTGRQPHRKTTSQEDDLN